MARRVTSGPTDSERRRSPEGDTVFDRGFYRLGIYFRLAGTAKRIFRRVASPRGRADSIEPARSGSVAWLGGLSLREGVMKQTFAIAIGGAAGQGVATPGDIFAKIFSRR